LIISKILIRDLKTREPLVIVPSAKKASEVIGINPCTVAAMSRGQKASRNCPYLFEKYFYPNEYVGPIRTKDTPKTVNRAYSSWKDQRRRCSNPKRRDYRWYGAKGIKVEYTARQYIKWYLEHIKTFEGTCPTVGRIDHSMNYTLGNIELIDMVDNLKERNERAGWNHIKTNLNQRELKSGLLTKPQIILE